MHYKHVEVCLIIEAAVVNWKSLLLIRRQTFCRIAYELYEPLLEMPCKNNCIFCTSAESCFCKRFDRKLQTDLVGGVIIPFTNMKSINLSHCLNTFSWQCATNLFFFEFTKINIINCFLFSFLMICSCVFLSPFDVLHFYSK